MVKFNDKVLANAQRRVKIAENIWFDFTGQLNTCESLTVSVYGDFVLVDDGQDRWLADKADYQNALDSVMEEIFENGVDEDDQSEAYSWLCNDCPAYYSRIGVGEFNDTPECLVSLLRETLNEVMVEEICEQLGINCEEK